jgi:hypothetical protein
MECGNSSCDKRAVYEVLGSRNQSYGKRCGKHATELVATLKRDEAKEAKAERKRLENEERKAAA